MWADQYQEARAKTAPGRREIDLNALYAGYHPAEKTRNGRGLFWSKEHDRLAYLGRRQDVHGEQIEPLRNLLGDTRLLR